MIVEPLSSASGDRETTVGTSSTTYVETDQIEQVEESSRRPLTSILRDEGIRSEIVVVDDDNEMIRHWKESPFAVGLTKATWADEDIGCCELLRNFTPITLSACFCSKVGAGRVGNMIVLAQRMEEYRDEATGRTRRRPRLLWVMGPYWMVMLCITLPVFTVLSFWTIYTELLDAPLVIVIAWAICTCVLFLALFMVSCKDPGIIYRHDAPPNGEENSWRWNDQALTYRPASAKYDTECAAIVERFDHVCPWMGTAIGINNIMWFRVFVTFAAVAVVFNAVLLIFK